jgi:hypothetical protein
VIRQATLLAAVLLATHAQQTQAQTETQSYQWRPMTGCTPGTPDALKRDLSAKGIKLPAARGASCTL